MKAISTKPTKQGKQIVRTAKLVNEWQASDALTLFQKNLEAMREWYRQQPGRGVDTGHLVLLELCLADVISALSAAMEGKPWQPPSP